MRRPLALLPHRWPGPPLEAELIARPNRFVALCRLGEREVVAHVPDRGRCLDLLVPGQKLILVAAPEPSGRAGLPRRTQFTALLARARTEPCPWVCLDPAGAPRLVEAALEAELLGGLRPRRASGREVAVGASRIDLLLDGGMLCEVKSVGAARGGVALFPDAPTLRGTRHLELLARRARRGRLSALVLCAQRGDARAIAADEAIDPAFAGALRRARAAGVVIAGLACAAEPEGMRLLGEVPVL